MCQSGRRKCGYKAPIFTCRSSVPPSPVGIVGIYCSAWPRGTCSSCERSGCTLPIPLRERQNKRRWCFGPIDFYCKKEKKKNPHFETISISVPQKTYKCEGEYMMTIFSLGWSISLSLCCFKYHSVRLSFDFTSCLTCQCGGRARLMTQMNTMDCALG